MSHPISTSSAEPYPTGSTPTGGLADPAGNWLALVVDAGYAVPTWPTEWFGLGVTGPYGAIVDAEFRRVGAPAPRQDLHNL